MEKEVIELSDLIGANYRIRLWLLQGIRVNMLQSARSKASWIWNVVCREIVLVLCGLLWFLFFPHSHLLCYIFVYSDIKDETQIEHFSYSTIPPALFHLQHSYSSQSLWFPNACVLRAPARIEISSLFSPQILDEWMSEWMETTWDVI